VERNAQKNATVNLIAAVVAFIAAFAITMFVNSLAGQAASVFLGLAILVAFTGWFQMRLEENERLEKLEMDELARNQGESALFAAKDSEVFPARRAREQFEKFFVPGFCVLLLLLEAVGAWLLWHWIGRPVAGLNPERAMPALSLFAIVSLLLFLLGRFSVTISRLEDNRLLRPGSSFLLAGAFVCTFTALGIAGVEAKFLQADVWVARGLCVLLGLMAAELLLTLLLEIYRPHLKGKVSRPLYDSRVVGLLAQPESLFTTAAQALDYQFGFKVSETWLYQLLQTNLPLLLLAQLAVLILSTCVVFVDAGEQAVQERFGRPVDTLSAGAHLKLPWPVDQIYRFRTEQIQSLYVGYTPDTNETGAILWTVAHNQEQNFLVGSSEPLTLKSSNSTEDESGDNLRAPPVSLISVSIPIQFQITNIIDWIYKNSDSSNLLSELATRAVVHYLAGADMNTVLSQGRLVAAGTLRDDLQTAANAHSLGAKIVFVGLQDIHPPTASQVAASYEKVVGALQTHIASNLLAHAEAIMTNSLADAVAFTTNSAAEALRVQLDTSAFANAALFTNQLPAFDTAPLIYKQRAYFEAFPAATANARKYVLLVTNTQNVLIYELEDKIRDDLINLSVPNNSSP
jgi:regulator of protease activity HflC (stomatin/prohibitin superfamily)